MRIVVAEPERAAELDALAEAAAANRAMLDRCWRERQVCVVAEAGDQVVGYGWLCRRMAMLEMGLAKPTCRTFSSPSGSWRQRRQDRASMKRSSGQC